MLKTLPRETEQVVAALKAQWAVAALREYSSILVSFIVHLGLIMVLALLTMRPGPGRGPAPVNIEATRPTELDGTIRLLANSEFEMSGPPSELLQPSPYQVPSPFVGQPTETKLVEEVAPWRDNGALLNRASALPTGGGLGARTPENRLKTALGSGGTQESENAVELGLYWLALHQQRNGSWAMHFEACAACRGACRNPPQGDIESPIAASGLSLLAFLGGGYTHQDGKYRENVQKAIYFLRENQTADGSFRGSGTYPMYGHGIATLALCEAVRMTQDQDLIPIAQRAVNFIVDAQHRGGGWRYKPKESGDVTVTGWQYMALYSAEKAGLDVPSTTRFNAERFLDTIQTEEGAFYGYMTPGAAPTPTAVGLLCRMYSGWNLFDGRLAKGVAMLEELGPSPNDVYYNYYATLVMRHYDEQGGWDAWNEKLREHLIATQSRTGHETGSWFFAEKHSIQAGRLYTTTMNILTLEVYYRYLPLYGHGR
jgi:hypothetical protein